MSEPAQRLIDVIVLALVQGLTEFLPVSSSGHLVLSKEFLGVDDPGVALEIVLHLGTLLAVVIYYANDWIELVRGTLRFLGGRRDHGAREAFNMTRNLVLATLPAALAGVLIGDRVEAAFQSPLFVCGALVFTGLLLLMTRLAGRGGGPVTPWRSLAVGVFQMLALFPGVSRSGSTIAGGMFSGIRSEEAARFSFLLSVPIILGAAAFKAPELAEGFAQRPDRRVRDRTARRVHQRIPRHQYAVAHRPPRPLRALRRLLLARWDLRTGLVFDALRGGSLGEAGRPE